MSGAKNFNQLNDNMQDILIKILANENITKLLYYNNATPLQCATLVDPTILLKTKIYTQTYVPPTDSQTSILCVWFDDFKQGDNNIAYKCNRVRFSIICHRELWQLDNGIRPFFIMHELDQIFNLKRNVGMGKNYFIRCDYRSINELYNSYIIDYEMWD